VAEKEKGFPNPKPRRRFDRPVSRRREHKRRRWRRSWGRRRASSRARICSPRPSATARSGISSTTAAPAEVSPPVVPPDQLLRLRMLACLCARDLFESFLGPFFQVAATPGRMETRMCLNGSTMPPPCNSVIIFFFYPM
jgi:hypothetical protein